MKSNEIVERNEIYNFAIDKFFLFKISYSDKKNPFKFLRILKFKRVFR